MSIGIHGADVDTVNIYDEVGNILEVRNVARIRIFLGNGYNDYVDEDFQLPILPNGVPATEEVYRAFLTDKVNERAQELGAKK